MNYDLIKERIAPCGLHCGKCFAFAEGDIKKKSKELKEHLGNFELYAKRFVELLNEPKFMKYSEFNEMLTYFTTVECKGCRNENCKLFKGCNVKNCSSQKGVDFCFQCKEFPCNNTGFDENLYNRFLNINRKIKQIGLEKYYDVIKHKSRY